MEAYANELMRKVVKPKHYAPVRSRGVDDIWALDLADFAEWHESNEGYKYVLVVVDVFSRYAWCRALKDKSAKQVWDALQSILDDSKKQPTAIWVDKGREFYNATWTAKLKALDIERYSTYGQSKASIAERFIQTMKHRVWRQFIERNTRKWIDILEPVVKDYNLTVHSALRMSPRDARTREDELLDRIPPVFETRPKYSLGDWVRTSRQKGIFEKGFHPNWSYEIFKIVGIRKNFPTLYELVDYYGERIEGAFYEPELQLVSDPEYFAVEKVLKERKVKGKKEKLVKFLGYKEPRWMPAESLSDL